jgi:Fe(3+) dicitrate transport protein
MINALIIVFREGFEAFLTVAIIVAYLRKTGRDWLRPAVYAGIAVSVVASFALGWVLRSVNQPLWEGVLALVAAVLVATFVIQMWRTAPRMKQHMERELDRHTTKASRMLAIVATFLFTLLMITREGMETALMLIQVRQPGFTVGAIMGAFAAAGLAWLWAHYAPYINLKRFFQVTGLFLLMFTAHVVFYAIHEFSEAELLPNSEWIHNVTEPYTPLGIYGKWITVAMIGICAAWLIAVSLLDRFKAQSLHKEFSMNRSFLNLFLGALLAVASTALGDEPSGETSPPAEQETPANAQPAKSPEYFERLTVLGGADKVHEIPGSAHQIDSQELQQQDHSDIHRILRTVPGVIVQEEEGHGLRPNIGMRGTGVERSQKITLLEDGVLIAPAPYSAPAAYYFPTPGRMETIEVRKGSSSIRQGPLTTGGVLNLISTSIPSQFSGRVNAAGGSDATARLHAHAGGSSGRVGWMIETYQMQTDGFKHLDGGGSTGFDLADYVGKVRINSSPDARFQQALELKLGYTTQNGDETYLGLTDADFALDPHRRYAASQEDVIDTEHEQYQLRHFLQITPAVDVTTTIYRNDFFRNWHKLDSVSGLGVSSVLANPAANAAALAILRGETDDSTGALRIRNNRRTYYSSGVQTVLAARFGSSFRHDVEIGARLHQDEEDRFQEDDRFGIAGGEMFLVAAGAPGSNANRVGQAEALSLFAQDEMAFGRWTLTPGVRFESIDLEQRDFGRTDPTRSGTNLAVRRNTLDVVIPGLGVQYRLTPSTRLFSSIHRGFAPPGPGSSEDAEAENSVNYEAGFRYIRGESNLMLVGFLTDYDNLLGRDTLSSGGTGSGDLFNGGGVEVRGLEFSLATDLAARRGWTVHVPLRLAYTFTEGEFQTSFETAFEDWAPRVEKGDELPYLPRNQWGISLGATRGRWASFIDVSHVDAMRTNAGQGPVPENERTDSYWTVDVSADYMVYRNLKAFAQVRNLNDATYVAARRPAGLRPGMPRTMLAGLEWTF